jgi:hypothetical protein
MEIVQALNKYVLFMPTLGTASETESKLNLNDYYEELVKFYKENGYLKVDNSKKNESMVFINDLKLLIVFTLKGYTDFKYEQQRAMAMQQGQRIIGG